MFFVSVLPSIIHCIIDNYSFPISQTAQDYFPSTMSDWFAAVANCYGWDPQEVMVPVPQESSSGTNLADWELEAAHCYGWDTNELELGGVFGLGGPRALELSHTIVLTHHVILVIIVPRYAGWPFLERCTFTVSVFIFCLLELPSTKSSSGDMF